MGNQPTITILGTGYVGLTTAALTAAAGMKTYLIDPNPTRLESVRAGKSFFYEAGLDSLVADGVANGRIIPTPVYAEAVLQSDIVISAVGTPDNPDGSSNLNYVFAAASEAAQYLKPDAVYVQKSTVPVGTGNKIRQLFMNAGQNRAYVSNPEFLREGTALADSLWFDRIVVGGTDANALAKVMQLYKDIESNRTAIAGLAGLSAPANYQSGAYISVALESAELIKVTANAFLALKISFANSIALLADQTGADILEVMDGVGADKRIGRAFLNAGRGYGGGCFPKDVSGLIAAGLELDVSLEIMEAAQAVNEGMPGYIIEKLQDALGGSLEHTEVAVLGLAFKAGTSDIRRSPGMHIANLLTQAGSAVRVFDPKAGQEAAGQLDERVAIAESIEQAIHDAGAIVVATDWPEFVEYTPQAYAAQLQGGIFVDAMNVFNAQAFSAAGIHYIGIGRSGNSKEHAVL